MLAVARRRGGIGRIHSSVNPFVPKPATPYQWLPMEDPKETDRKLQFLRKAFGRMANVDAVIKSARTGVSQSILALADRRGGRAPPPFARPGGGAGGGGEKRGPAPRASPFPRPPPR